jgi:DNA-binding MarR family transcriptional regulator
VDRLENQGYVERRAHPSDRRTTLVAILPEGRKVAKKASVALNERVFSEPGVSNDDAKNLVSLLRKLRVGAGDFDA